MQEISEVQIGIQARSTSKRLPGKTLFKINDKTLLGHILDAANSCKKEINMRSMSNGMMVKVTVLCPKEDQIAAFCKNNHIYYLEGPEDDVLARYNRLSHVTNADYIVRLTADCPLVPAYAIQKAIKIAVKNKYDYCSNVDPRFRTYPDGFDIEVISKRAMEWLNENARLKEDREHVTTLLRKEGLSNGFRFGVIIGYIDHSDFSNTKLSVDTEEDLSSVTKHIQSIQSKIDRALSLYGKGSVHRF